MPNTTHCLTCRLAADLAFIGSRTTKCDGCQQEFAQSKRGQTICATCTWTLQGTRTGLCNICTRDKQPLVDAPVAVCVNCVDSPSLRKTVIAALIKKVGALIASKEENARVSLIES